MLWESWASNNTMTHIHLKACFIIIEAITPQVSKQFCAHFLGRPPNKLSLYFITILTKSLCGADKLLFLSVCWIWGQAATWIQYTNIARYKLSTWIYGPLAPENKTGHFLMSGFIMFISKLWCRWCFDEITRFDKIISFRRNHSVSIFRSGF
jgi:hypothetical protein